MRPKIKKRAKNLSLMRLRTRDNHERKNCEEAARSSEVHLPLAQMRDFVGEVEGRAARHLLPERLHAEAQVGAAC